MTAMTVLTLPDPESLADLATFVGRAKRLDPDGAIRLVGHGTVLAAYVSPVHGAGGPTVLGLRTLQLALPSDLDVTVPLAALTDRFARRGAEGGAGGESEGESGGEAEGEAEGTALAVPPAEAVGVAWAGISPPRTGWVPVGTLDPAQLRGAADDGIREITVGAPDGSGATAVARLRASVWGRDLPGVPGVPAGVAFAATGLAFLADDEPCVLVRAGSWARVTTSRGHVLARRALL